MRIALFTPTFLPKFCGAEIVHHQLALHFLRMGHEPVVITSSRLVRQLRRQGEKPPYPVIAFPSRVLRWAAQRPRLAQFVAGLVLQWLQLRHRFDVWHLSNAFPTGFLCLPWAKRRKLPVLVRSEGEDVQVDASIGYGWRLKPGVEQAIRDTLPLAGHCAAITDAIRQSYLQLGVESSRISLIPNGVDLASFHQEVNAAEVREKHGLPQDRFLFLCVCRNHPKKGLPYLLAAAAQLKQQLGDFAVAIVGRNNSKLQDDIAKLGLQDVVFPMEEMGAEPGERSAPPRSLVELYLAADCFVFPSLMEAFGMVLVEAMAAGLPVITTSAPGCREVVREGHDALMVPPSDPAALAESMLHMLSDKGQRDVWRQRGLERAAEFDWQGVAERYLEAYEDLGRKNSEDPKIK